MPLQMQQPPSTTLSGQKFNCQDNQAKNKYKQADTVNAMHIADPFVFGPVGIFFPQVEIFGYLFPDSHKNKVKKLWNGFAVTP